MKLTKLEQFVWDNRDRVTGQVAMKLNRSVATITAAYNRAHAKMRDAAVPLKLFVWTDHNSDYTSGLAVAIAKTEADARKLIVKERGGFEPTSWGDLSIYPLDKPIAFEVSGGG